MKKLFAVIAVLAFMLSFAPSDLPRFFPLSCGFSDTFVVPIISHVGDVRKCEKAAPGHKKSSESFISHIQILLIHV